MTRMTQLGTTLAVGALLLVSLGCPQRGNQAISQAGGAPGSPAAGTPGVGPGAAVPSAAATGKKAPAGLADLEKKRATLQSYAVTMTMDGKPMTHFMKFDHGKLIRMRMDMPGMPAGESYLLVMTDKHATYLVNPKTKTAMKMPEGKGEAPGAGSLPPAAPDLKDLEAKMPAWGEETIDGIACWKVETAGEKGAKSTVWLDKQYGLARQMQFGDKLIKEKYDQINAVPDSEFELPPGTKETTGMPGMSGMGSMPNMPKMPGGHDMPNMPPGHGG